MSYSRSRGLFAGVALDGSVIRPDANSNTKFAADNRAEVAKQVEGLKAVLDAMSAPPAPPQPPAPGVLMPPVPPARP